MYWVVITIWPCIAAPVDIACMFIWSTPRSAILLAPSSTHPKTGGVGLERQVHRCELLGLGGEWAAI